MADPVDDRPGDDPAEAAGLVDHFFRHESGRLTAVLTRRYGPANIETIEDAVQDALASALSTWARDGVPDNPSAWLTRAATNRVLDHLRRRARAARSVPALKDVTPDTQPPPELAPAHAIDDDELRMLFVCCDPALEPRSQLVLSLKLLCGFGVQEIATRLFITVANTEKILSRGRARLREAWSRAAEGTDARGEDAPSAPPLLDLKERLEAVQTVVYLLFNEGYSSQRDDEVIRRELCEEALRLAERLVSHPDTDAPSSWALLALMHFHVARLDARLGEGGALLLLTEQDRSRWDALHIQRGLLCLAHAGAGEEFSRFHGEAAVMAQHCLAPSFEATRWDEIVDLYEMLERRHPSPIYTLNRAVALAEWKGPEEGLRLLEEMTPPAWLQRYYLWDATLGELLRRAGRFERAAACLHAAAGAAPTSAERALFEERRARAERRDPSR